MKITGRHYLSVLRGCSKNTTALNDKKKLEALSRKALKSSGMTLFHMAAHNFNPHGITLLAIIGESHFSLHTYPEINGCVIDILTCGKQGAPEKGLTLIKKFFAPETAEENYFAF